MRPVFLRGAGLDLCPVEPTDESTLAAFPWRLLPLAGSAVPLPLLAVDAAGGVVGVARLEGVDWVRREASLALRWGGPDAGAAEAIRLAAGYAFDELNLDWLDARVHPADAAMLGVLEGAGFLVEDRRRDAVRLARARPRP